MRPYSENLPWTPLAIFMSNVRRIIPTHNMEDLYTFDKAWLEFSRASQAFRITQSIESFRALNSSWARMDRLMKQTEEKYGAYR